jgi:Arc/MetJ family transcription regulator
MIDELLFTLKIAREALPSDAHAVHAVRLYLIERMIRRVLEQELEYWRASFDHAEQIGDSIALGRLEGDKSDE